MLTWVFSVHFSSTVCSVSQWKMGVGNKVKVAMPTAQSVSPLGGTFLNMLLCVVCIHICVGHTVEVIRQIVGVSSLLPSPGSVLVARNQTRVLGFVAGALTC